MKNSLYALMIAGLTLALITSAQVLPITSVEQLGTYAIDRAVMASAGVSQYLPAGSGITVAITNSTARGISNAIASIKHSFEIPNPADPIYPWANVVDNDWDLLFWGGQTVHLVTAKGGYDLPPEFGKFKLQLADEVPIKVAGLIQALVYLRDTSGRIVSGGYQLRVQNGKLYFPWRLCETNAIVAGYVQTSESDYGWRYWDVRSGTTITPEQLSGVFETMIEGIVSATDGPAIVRIESVGGVGKNKALEFYSTGKQFSAAQFQTTEGGWPLGAWVRRKGSLIPTWYPVAPSTDDSRWILFPTQAGAIYYVIPEWDPSVLSPPREPWYPPNYGWGEGGKG